MSGEDLYSGTESMRSGLELDADKVEAFFRENLQDFDGNAEITQFKGGQSNPTYKVSTDRKSWVIRRKPPGQLLPSAHAVDREFWVLTALGKTDVPVPKTHLLCMDETILGTPFYVMDYVKGQVLCNSVIPVASQDLRLHVFVWMNDSIAKLHQVDYESLELSDFGRPGNYVGRQLIAGGNSTAMRIMKRSPKWTYSSNGFRKESRIKIRLPLFMEITGWTT